MRFSLPVAKSREDIEYLLNNKTPWFLVMVMTWKGTGGPVTAKVTPITPYDDSAQEAYRVVANSIDELVYTITSLTAGKDPYTFIEIHAHVPGYAEDESLLRTLYEVRVEEGDI